MQYKSATQQEPNRITKAKYINNFSMTVSELKRLEVWFITGSQHLYGGETLREVAKHSSIIAKSLNEQSGMPVKIMFKPVVKSTEEVYNICLEANIAKNCIGIITWMHTFSPAKMWINGLKILHKPLCHLHTQFNRDIPWDSIDMDFMNTNQSAHGDREFGFIMSRLRMDRKVVVGHWQDKNVVEKIASCTIAAIGWYDWQGDSGAVGSVPVPMSVSPTRAATANAPSPPCRAISLSAAPRSPRPGASRDTASSRFVFPAPFSP